MNTGFGPSGGSSRTVGSPGPHGSGGFGAGSLPRLKTLSALVEVYPELGKLATLDKGGSSVTEVDQPVGQSLATRTKSEEEEFHHQKSVELMRREQMQNEILLDTVKRIQGSSAGSLYENEIRLLRTVIEQKQGFVNKLHAEAMELNMQIEEWEQRLRDEEDRSKEERERILEASQEVEAAIKEISQDKRLAVQRLGQYELLYTRTVEDRNRAEAKMSRARELVSMGREDLGALGECLLKTKAAQEKHDRELSAAFAKLESSRSMWRSSLEQRTREIDAIIHRYEAAKSLRMLEEDQATRQRLEAERVRHEMETREREHVARLKKECERMNAVQIDQWRVVCAAAGVPDGSTAEAVIEAYEGCKNLAPVVLREKSRNKLQHDGCSVMSQGGRNGLSASRSENKAGEMPESPCQHGGQETVPAEVQRDITPSISIRVEMSLRMIRRKLGSHLGQGEAADDDALVEQLRHLQPVGDTMGPAGFSKDQPCDNFEIITDGDPWEAAAAAIKASGIDKDSPPTTVRPTAMTRQPAAEQVDSDTGLTSPILSRQEIKARSRKMHLKLNL